jgi:hypothetical protein
MRNLIIICFVGLMLLSSCGIPTNCYMCVTTTSVDYSVQRSDTSMQCSFTAKDANNYETANTVNGPMGNSNPGETKATSCHIPTK